MIKNGKYAYYKGNEYKFSRDADGNYIIITSDLKKTWFLSRPEGRFAALHPPGRSGHTPGENSDNR